MKARKADTLAVTRKWSALLKLLAVSGPEARADSDPSAAPRGSRSEPGAVTGVVRHQPSPMS
jgi:hypothetical protein